MERCVWAQPQLQFNAPCCNASERRVLAVFYYHDDGMSGLLAALCGSGTGIVADFATTLTFELFAGGFHMLRLPTSQTVLCGSIL